MELKSILVLDDEIELLNLFKVALQNHGLSVFDFTHPKMALEYFKNNSNSFSLIITDLRMPKMNGIEFAYRVRQLDREIKIWLATSFVLEDITDNPLFTFAHIERIIEKPISIRKLIELVKSTSNMPADTDSILSTKSYAKEKSDRKIINTLLE